MYKIIIFLIFWAKKKFNLAFSSNDKFFLGCEKSIKKDHKTWYKRPLSSHVLCHAKQLELNTDCLPRYYRVALLKQYQNEVRKCAEISKQKILEEWINKLEHPCYPIIVGETYIIEKRIDVREYVGFWTPEEKNDTLTILSACEKHGKYFFKFMYNGKIYDGNCLVASADATFRNIKDI